MKKIPLTQGQAALVDDEDYEELSKDKWYASQHRSGSYYATRSTKRDASGNHRTIYMHRQILGVSPGEHVDHANHRTLDNRRVNIRKCSRSLNNANAHKRKGCSSRFKGVTWCKRRGKWTARIKCEGRKRKHLGYFGDEIAAARAYKAEAIIQFGEFALLNDV